MILKDSKGNWDWWKINAVISVVGGVEFIITRLFAGNNFAIFTGMLNLLIAWAFWKKSMVIFNLEKWIIVIATFFLAIAFVFGKNQFNFSLPTNPLEAIESILSFAGFAAFIMLWRQLRIEKKIKW